MKKAMMTKKDKTRMELFCVPFIFFWLFIFEISIFINPGWPDFVSSDFPGAKNHSGRFNPKRVSNQFEIFQKRKLPALQTEEP